MEWHESQQQPGIVEVVFPAAQAEALHAACVERTFSREKSGNPALEFDERLIQLTDNVPPHGIVTIPLDVSGLAAVGAVSNEFAAHTTEAVAENTAGLDPLQRRIRGFKRCDLGVAALALSLEAQSAMMAYSTDFHGQLEAFMRTAEQTDEG